MSDQSDRLVTAIQRAAIELPGDQAHLLAAEMELEAGPSASARQRCLGVVPADAFRSHVRQIFDAWTASEEPPAGLGIGLALRAAASAIGELRNEHRLDIVWTGPSSYRVPVRQTREVLLDVIGSAEKSLIVVSFAAYKVQAVSDALRDAADRGVDVRLVLETKDAGVLDHDAADAFASLGSSVALYEWPIDQREGASAGLMPAMHAKAAIADEHTALVTSANLTGSAVSHNMELGVLIRGGPAPRRLSQHFKQLMADGKLVAPS